MMFLALLFVFSMPMCPVCNLFSISGCRTVGTTILFPLNTRSSTTVNWSLIFQYLCVDLGGRGIIKVNNGTCEDGGTGDFISLTLDFPLCALGTDCTDCGARVDADGDGHEDNANGGAFMFDCDDSNPYVNSSATEVPNNGLDDDCDGVVDNGGGSPSSETDCSNGIDDDSDGDVDCADLDCSSDPACVSTGCPSGETADCNGNCAPTTWLGDGYCDDGTYEHNGVQIYFNCTQFNNDNGDCP